MLAFKLIHPDNRDPWCVLIVCEHLKCLNYFPNLTMDRYAPYVSYCESLETLIVVHESVDFV